MPGLDFLDGASAPDASTPVVIDPPADALVVQPAPETVEQPSGPVRGPDGKFAARTPAEATPEPVQVQQPEPAPVAPQQPPEPQHAPLTALLDERDKRQAAERRAQEFEQRLQQYERTQQPQQQASPSFDQMPDPYDAPQDFAVWLQQVVENSTGKAMNAANNVALNISEERAREKHGDDAVDAMATWMNQQSPSVHQEVLSQRNPYEFAVQLHQRQTLAASLQPSDLAQFRAWQASQGQAAPNPAQVQQRAAPPSPPSPPAPRSIANATSAGGAAHVPQGPGQAYDRLPF